MILPNGSSATLDDRRFAYIIRNHGNVTAHDVRVWLYDKDGQDVSIKPQAGFDVAPDESVESQGVSAPLDVQADEVRFGVRWWDGTGINRRMTNMPPTL